jgi:hypothetical protein
VAALAFVSDGEASVAEGPGDGPFDLPAVAAEAGGGFGARPGDAWHDSASAQPSEVVGGVVRLVAAELGRASAAWSATGADRRQAENQGLEGLAVVGVGGGDPDDQGEALRIGQDVEFAAGFASIDRVRPGQRAPLFARADAPSMMAEVQSSSPRAPSRSRTARCKRGHTPALVQAANRRCAVAGETPNDGGRCRQAHPLVSTYTTAVNTARSSSGALPPPWRRGENAGNNGPASSHRPSGTSRCDRSTPMKVNHAAGQPPTT